MRTRGKGYLAAAMMIFVSTSWAWAGGPVAVSPGATDGVATIGQNCPTFSWSSAGDVASYRLDVYEQITGDAVSHDQMQLLARSVISKTIAVPALSWTPSEGECLDRGRQYVWYVLGVHADGEGQWSGGMGFRVEANELSSEYKAAINEAVKEYLASAAGKAVLSNAAGGAGLSMATVIGSNGSIRKNEAPDRVAVKPMQASAIVPMAATSGLTIGQNGSVGIGLDNPAAKLEVSGNAIFSGASQQMLYIIGSDVGGTWMNLDNTSAGGRSWGLISSGSGNGEGAGKLLIRDHAASAVRATFDAGGNMGIGTDVPAAKLDVNGDIKAQNLPAIKSVQNYRSANCIDLTTHEEVDTLTVNVPADGFLELMATLHGFMSTSLILTFALYEQTTSLLIHLTEGQLWGFSGSGSTNSGVITLHWVLPTSVGIRSFKTIAFAGDTGYACTSTLTARFFPASL